jgi:peroxiredoxin
LELMENKMSLAHTRPKLCASAILLVGLIAGLAVYWSFASERSGRLDAAQADVHEVKLASPATSSPASASCCKHRAAKQDATAVTDATAAGQDSEDKTGLAIGKSAPAFTLTDQNGRQVSLQSLLKKGPVAVVFHRSVDWCLYCKLQMAQLQRILNEIEAAGGQVVGISYDPVEKIEPFAKRNRITFPLLSDAGSKTIDAYGIRSSEAPPEKSGFARHAAFIIDQDGVIRSKLFRLSYRERPAVDALINAIKEAGKPAGGPHS